MMSYIDQSIQILKAYTNFHLYCGRPYEGLQSEVGDLGRTSSRDLPTFDQVDLDQHTNDMIGLFMDVHT